MKKIYKSCEWCDTETILSEEGEDGFSLGVEVYPNTGFIACFALAKSEDGEPQELQINLPLHYCPNCGAKLAE